MVSGTTATYSVIYKQHAICSMGDRHHVTQVPVGIEEGLKHPSAIRCDELISILKTRLTDYVGVLSEGKLIELGQALSIALGIDGVFIA